MKGRGSQLKTRLHSDVASIEGGFFAWKAKGGYTIVEVMIFLAVSTGLFVMIMATFSGRQAKAEFATAVRDMESRLQDVANDVSSGYYANAGNFSCTVNASGVPQPTAGSGQQGTRKDCTFIGRVAQFDVTGNDKQYNLFTVIGSRLGPDGEDAENLDDANPVPLLLPGFVEQNRFPVGLVAHSMRANGVPISAVGFFTTFGSGPTGESSLSINVVPLGDGNDSQADVANAILGVSEASAKNPNSGVEICMNGDSTNQHAVLKLGGNSGRLTTEVTIGNGTCTSAGY